MSRLRILIASDSKDAVEAIQGLIRGAHNLSAEGHIIELRSPEPLRCFEHAPDLLLLRVGADSQAALEALAGYSHSERPPLIVIGDANHPGCMRAAMQAGARDFLTEPVSRAELLEVIARLASEQKPSSASGQCRLTAFVNGKGGSGATFLACNVAHLFAELSGLKTVLLGLDTQFASLPRYLDLQPKRGLVEALEVAGDLDGAAVEAYLTRHDSGLALLAASQDKTLLQQDLMTERLETVLQLLFTSFERCVVDLPRRIEPFSALVLEQADQIVLVLQQSVPSLHDTARTYDLLVRHLAIPPERITIIVNRYRRAAAVELSDIQQYFGDRKVTCIPNDYRSVTESIDIGVPIYRHARRSPVTKALIQLENQLGGRATGGDKSFLPRLLRTG